MKTKRLECQKPAHQDPSASVSVWLVISADVGCQAAQLCISL